MTLYHEAVVFKQFMVWCVSRGLIRRNPLDQIKIAKPPRNKKPAPTAEQLCAILRHCSPWARSKIEVLMLTGVRIGELQGLEKADIDLTTGFIDVRRQLSGTTKTKNAIRRIPIHPRLRHTLNSQLIADNHKVLFTASPSRRYPNGGHHISAKRLNERFKTAVSRAGYGGFTLHSLRHFFNAYLINAGVPERAVKTWMGHADRCMTAVYYHLCDEDARRLMDCVSFDGLIASAALGK